MRPLRRILCVEDDPDIQLVAKLALEAIGGFEVRVCSSGDEALLVGPAFAPDLVLLDVMMPGMDGPTTLRAMRRLPELAETPVAFMTAKVKTGALEEYRAAGACHLIAKPFDPMVLSDQIRDIWSSANAD